MEASNSYDGNTSEAFDFVTRHYDYLHSDATHLAHKMLRCERDDLRVQEAFSDCIINAVTDAIRRFDESKGCSLKTFARDTLRFYIRKWISAECKHNARFQNAFTVESDNDFAEPGQWSHCEFNSAMEKMAAPRESFALDTTEEANSILATLPDIQRQIVSAYAMHGLNYGQIAARIGMSESWVRLEYQKALTAIRALYGSAAINKAVYR